MTTLLTGNVLFVNTREGAERSRARLATQLHARHSGAAGSRVA